MLTPTTKRQIGEANGNCLACTVVARGLFLCLQLLRGKCRKAPESLSRSLHSHQMQLRRERVHFYLSTLLKGKMPISFACASGEENRDAQCQMRCKNGFALSVGVRLSTQEALRCISMNSRLTTFYLNQKIKQGFFLYYISCNENNVGKFLKL
jgi:hypothetical protein